tara:strand:- start:6946 stop:7332 length:387 start_codon:yes stop_codon:yes gene_type:complete
MTKTGKIKSVDPNGLWNGLTKYKVTFADGNQYTFFAKGNFKFDVGDTITYEVTNEEYKNAKIPQDQYKKEAKPIQDNSQAAVNFVSKDHLIVRQTCIKAAAEFNAGRSTADANSVVEDAQLFFNFITQ